MKTDKIRVGITHGDVNGIGYEIIIKTLMDMKIIDMCTPIVYGSPKVAAYHRKALNITNFSFNNIKNPDEANPKRANIINCIDDSVRVELGKSTSIAGTNSYTALEAAMKDLKDNKIDVLVTAPINKKNIQSKDFHFPGHTEYLNAHYPEDESLMIMVSDSIKIAVVTGHIPLNTVSENLTSEKILNKLRILNDTLVKDFTNRKPKIAVLALNPHAGDDGILGTEEKEVILPAIETAQKENIMAFGPFPADGFFGSNQFKNFDAILAMYHDQGLIPFKALSFDEGINYTAGLPIIRTSPAHGTAYELAGQNIASPVSFRNALYWAIDIFKSRKLHTQLNKNPLPSYDINEMEN